MVEFCHHNPKTECTSVHWKAYIALNHLKSVNDNDPIGIEVGIVEVEGFQGEWLVEAIDHGSDGEIYRAIFTGPMAELRARNYALLTYGFPSKPTQTSRST
jgi:hypothetical protein